MLQQTRVAAVIPYYERFLTRFPTPQSLAGVPEQELLTIWAGLGYYSRARNMQRAARQMTNGFPQDYESIRALTGVGDYTAAAVASIAFGLPHAVVDGNVRRVVIRLTGDAGIDVPGIATKMMDRGNPARSNQALMELGALICLPRDPLCIRCPVQRNCEAHRQSLADVLPPKRVRPAVQKERILLLIRRHGKTLLTPSPRVKGFWELPEPFAGAVLGATFGSFRHSITTTQYTFQVQEARISRKPKMCRWFNQEELDRIPLSTIAKKALQLP